MKLAPLSVLVLVAAIVSASAAGVKDGIAILPESITLAGPHARHGLLLQRVHDSRLLGMEGVGRAQFTSANPAVAKVEDGYVIPVSNGSTRVTANLDDMTASIPVEVVDFGRPDLWSFRNHVEPILARFGCSTGACHGALAGKGGFKLSLRGYDPVTDHHTITRQARGRRVEFSDPGRSLLLAKPSGAIPHKGGLRFDVDSLEYTMLSEWITSGAPGPSENDPRLSHLEVLPASSLLRTGQEQRIMVRAHYSDGRVEDVSRWAKYASTDESVAKVDEWGAISVMGHGEGAVTAWFSSQIAISRITVPYPYEVPSDVYASSPRRNFIDELVLSKLQSLNLRPAPRSTDDEFLRRAFLDTIGLLPTVEEARGFLADTSPNKRGLLIDQLLTRSEFVDYWTYKWSDLLLIDGRRLRPESVKAYYRWIRNEVASNTPWDEFVTRVLTATGSSLENGAVNFYSLHQSPEDMSENACQAFLGLSIGCAKCHNHPLEKWTNNQYYAMANLFSRVRAKGWGGDSRSGDGERILFTATKGELIQPLTGKAQPPTPLDGDPLPFQQSGDRRIHLAKWLTSVDNPYFARAITNRVWANFFGVGLVEAVDDMRLSNPSSNVALLAAAADYLVQNQFDLKALMRVILQSETYQRSSLPLAENHLENRFYSRHYPRRLMAEVLLDAVSQVTGVPTEFTHVRQTADFDQKTDEYPKGTRAVQLYDSAVASYFLETFGRNERAITCECERSNEPSMVQVLHISNGATINDKLSAADGFVAELASAEMDHDQILNEVFLAALSRFPTNLERTQLTQELAAVDADDRRQAIEDLVWGVLSTREFLFNH